MLPATRSRVSDNTSEVVNDRIRRKTEASIAKYADASPEQISRRLVELDKEWDINAAWKPWRHQYLSLV